MQNNLKSFLKFASVYVAAFLIILALFNGPSIIAFVQYPLTHSEESENERLTAQYRALYGYETQQRQQIQPPNLPGQPSVPVVQTVVRTPGPQITNNNWIRISKINIAAPIIRAPSDNEGMILNALKGGVVLYPGSANPGQNGTSIIVGHSSSNPPWTKYSAIFSLLNKLAPNDLISISFEGKEYTYQVQAIRKGSVQQIINSGLGGDLILASCWPVGTDQGRIAVIANLIR